jgi:choline dehydrogenase-like flavoprotein
MKWTGDAIVIGSGFGGGMAAHALVNAGQRVLMLERGGWVARGTGNESDHGVGLVSRAYAMDAPYHVTAGGRRYRSGSWSCVGGQSVFYGGALFRFREQDFEYQEEIVGDSGAAWPFAYDELEPFYAKAEALLAVSGDSGNDPTEPPRSAPYPHRSSPLAHSARAIAGAATRLGLKPSRIPLAFSYAESGSRRPCTRCGAHEQCGCATDAKYDIATGMIPELARQGMTLRPHMLCVRLLRTGSRITAVECVNRLTGERESFTAPRIILGAGALATPHLLLASNLASVNSAGGALGRYLTRHCNAVVYGVYARRPNPNRELDKQIAFFDFYRSAGCIQQMTPPEDLVRAYLPRIVRTPAARVLSYSSGLLVIAEDQPREQNGVHVDWSKTDRYGRPTLHVRHSYSARDQVAAAELIAQSKRVLRETGALFSFVRSIETFSHALGTVRMGTDDHSSPLDENGLFRGLDNLWVVDGSALPRSAGVNPSLTIAANALRIGAHVAGQAQPARDHRPYAEDTRPLTCTARDR